MSTKEANKTIKLVADGIRKRENKIERTRSSEYQTLKSGGKLYKRKSSQFQECEQYSQLLELNKIEKRATIFHFVICH